MGNPVGSTLVFIRRGEAPMTNRSWLSAAGLGERVGWMNR